MIEGPTMKNLALLDSNSFPAFLEALELLNFTKAAKNLGMTQSGISQHIAKLENDLEVKLFDRVNRKVYGTEAAFKLKNYLEKIFRRFEIPQTRVKC